MNLMAFVSLCTTLVYLCNLTHAAHGRESMRAGLFVVCWKSALCALIWCEMFEIIFWLCSLALRSDTGGRHSFYKNWSHTHYTKRRPLKPSANMISDQIYLLFQVLAREWVRAGRELVNKFMATQILTITQTLRRAPRHVMFSTYNVIFI